MAPLWTFQEVQEYQYPGMSTYGIRARKETVCGLEIIESIHQVTSEYSIAKKLAHLLFLLQLSPSGIRRIIKNNDV